MGKQARLHIEKHSPAQKLIAATKRPDSTAVAELVEVYIKLVQEHQAALIELAAAKAALAQLKDRHV